MSESVPLAALLSIPIEMLRHLVLIALAFAICVGTAFAQRPLDVSHRAQTRPTRRLAGGTLVWRVVPSVVST